MLILNPGAATARPASGQIPEVESLIGKDFRSVLTKGLAQVGARSLRVEFFEHSGNPEQDSAPTLLFSAGCNANGSRFRISGGRLIAYGGFTGTDVGCVVNPDPGISGLLEKGFTIRKFGNRLVLSRPAEGVKLILVRDLPGKPATMESLDGKSFRSVVIRGVKVKWNKMYLSFTTGPLPREDDQGRQVEGPLMLASIGCNSMGGEYSVRNGLVKWIGDIYSTAMMCFPYNDGWVGGLLGKGARAWIAGPVLTLTRGKDRAILLRTET